jgi:hypothetical protein
VVVFSLCVISGKRCTIVVWCCCTAAASTSLCASLVLGFLHCLFLLRDGSWLDYFGRNLSKKGWLGFSPIWGFPRINSCVLLFLFMLLIFQYMI